MDNIKMCVGQRLTALRKKNKLRQSDIAKRLGLTTAAYQNYEYGKREAGYSTLLLLADMFDVSLDYLLCRTDDNSSSVSASAALDPFSKNEKMLLSAYLNIDDRSKTALMSIIKEISDRYQEQKERPEYQSDKEKESKFA